MPDGPDLPLLTLACGPWRAEVFDPRPNPSALGARYVHGGYVAGLYYQDRLLTDRPKPAWNPYEGQGLPEVFELAFAHAAAQIGEPYLRLGAGQLLKEAGGPSAGGLPQRPVAWQVAAREPALLAMSCQDAVTLGGAAYAYRLERVVSLHEWGLRSETRLHLRCPWSHPVAWFAHPFFRQSAGDRTGFSLPASAKAPPGFAPDAEGLYRLPPQGGFGPITGVWGSNEPIAVALDPALGAPALQLTHSYPLDKLVVYGTPQAASLEPYWARAWHDDEAATWVLEYRA